MERFSLDCVDEPTSVTNNDRLDVYNNIVLFKVREDQRRNSPSEMHIFQCIGRPVSPYMEYETPNKYKNIFAIKFGAVKQAFVRLPVKVNLH